MKFDALINQYYNELNENERYIAKYIMEHIEECQEIAITDLAEKTLTSKSTILRFAKKLQFSGFSELKYFLKQTHRPTVKPLKSSYNMLEEDLVQTTKLFKQQINSDILQTFNQANRVFVYGTGWGQRNVINTFVRSFIPLQIFPLHIESQNEVLNILKNSATKNDLFIILSLSGNNKPNDRILNMLSLKQIPVLSITELSSNKLASYATYNLFFQTTALDAPVDENVSLLPMYQIIDLFFRAYLEEFDQEISSKIE